MMRRKRRLIELIRNYSRSHHYALSDPTDENHDKFTKNLNELVEYLDRDIFLPICDDCFSAAHPEKNRHK